jgi:hypothetical protein
VSSSSVGVIGVCDAGIGVLGFSSSGHALKTHGRLSLSTSGVAIIPAGSISKKLHPSVAVTVGSFVLLTPMANLGGRDLWFTKNVRANTISVHISARRTSATKVSWLLLG